MGKLAPHATFGPCAPGRLRKLGAMFGRAGDAFRAPMELAVRVVTFERQVLRAIIRALVIEVMHLLSRSQRATKNLLHNEPMLTHVAIIPNVNIHITIADKASGPARHSGTVVATEKSLWLTLDPAAGAVRKPRDGRALSAAALTLSRWQWTDFREKRRAFVAPKNLSMAGRAEMVVHNIARLGVEGIGALAAPAFAFHKAEHSRAGGQCL